MATGGEQQGTSPRNPAGRDRGDAFWEFAEAGRELARLHVEYEAVDEYPLKFIETGGGAKSKAQERAGPSSLRSLGMTTKGKAKNKPTAQKSVPWLPFTYRVIDKMRLAKDKKSLKVNDSLTLGGIPAEAFEYRLGNRSALEWVIDQYRVTEDKRSGIRQDPNRADDEQYIVQLVGRVIRVSVETVRIVKALPGLGE